MEDPLRSTWPTGCQVCRWVCVCPTVYVCPCVWVYCISSGTADTATRGSAHPSLPSPHSPPPPLHHLSSLLLGRLLTSRDFTHFWEHRAVYVVCVWEGEELVWPHLDTAAAGWTGGWIFLVSPVMCALLNHKSSLPLAVFKLFSNNPPPPAGLHLALESSCLDSYTRHPSLLWDQPTTSLSAPHPHLRLGCPTLRPCAE